MVKTIVFKKNEDVACRIIDSQAVILSPGDACLHTLNEVGTFIWEHVDGKKTVEDIVVYVCGKFDVDKKEAENDISHFLGNLLRRNLIIAKKK